MQEPRPANTALPGSTPLTVRAVALLALRQEPVGHLRHPGTAARARNHRADGGDSRFAFWSTPRLPMTAGRATRHPGRRRSAAAARRPARGRRRGRSCRARPGSRCRRVGRALQGGQVAGVVLEGEDAHPRVVGERRRRGRGVAGLVCAEHDLERGCRCRARRPDAVASSTPPYETTTKVRAGVLTGRPRVGRPRPSPGRPGRRARGGRARRRPA